MQQIRKTIIVDAPREAVWHALTNADSMRQWMGEPEMRLDVLTDWKVGGPILITGFHHVPFRNVGTIERFDPGQALRYTHMSSLSGLADESRNHTIIAFELESVPTGTSLTLTVDNFPNEVIFKHLDFYWRTTIELLGKFVERFPWHPHS